MPFGEAVAYSSRRISESLLVPGASGRNDSPSLSSTSARAELLSTASRKYEIIQITTTIMLVLELLLLFVGEFDNCSSSQLSVPMLIWQIIAN